MELPRERQTPGGIFHFTLPRKEEPGREGRGTLIVLTTFSCLGLGLSAFSSTLATIYQFKPQGISLSATFLCVISYILGKMLELIPRRGILRYLNPCPFNLKEHAAILIMSSTAAHAAEAIEVIAVQRLWYNTSPSDALCIFLFFSSQCLGYGIAGVLREILVYPTKVILLTAFWKTSHDLGARWRRTQEL